jgi:hypothetical protein
MPLRAVRQNSGGPANAKVLPSAAGFSALVKFQRGAWKIAN